MTASKAAGFWSYTHRDNEADGGRLLRLAERVREEYELLTGNELTMFVDRKDLSWGDEWDSRINHALQSTTFLIAIITPRYLQSHPCRKEVLTFVGKAQSLGLTELFLPIVYVPIKQLEDEGDGGDEVVALISRTQYMDWHHLRLLDETSAEYRLAVNALAARLMEIAENLENNPPELPASSADIPVRQLSDEPGLVDIMATAEETFPAWAATVTELGELLNRLQEIITPMADRLKENEQAGKGFRGRLTLLRELAAEIDPIADRMVEVSSRYTEYVVTLDPAMQAAIEQMRQGTDGSDEEQRASFVSSMQTFDMQLKIAVNAMSGLIEVLKQAQELSRDLARPTRKMSDALTALLDGHALIDGWVTGVQASQA